MIKVVGEAVDARIDKLVQNGTMTFDQMRREAAETLADTLNTTVLDITARTAKIAENSRDQVAVMLAGKQALQSVGRDAFHLAQKIKNSGNAANDADRAILDNMLNAMGDLEANLKAIQKSAARTTASGRITIEEIVATQGDPKALRKLQSTWRRFLNGHNEYWINAILSGPKTHLVNISSNAIQLGLIPADRIIGGALTGDRETMRQGFKMYMGYKRAFKDATKMAWQALKTGDNVLDPLHSPIDSPRFAIDSDADGALGSAIRGFGKGARIPTRFLMAEDEWFKQMSFRANLYANTSIEGLDRGLKGNQLAQYIEDAFDKGIDKRGRGLDDSSLAVARESTFTTGLREDTVGASVQRIISKHPAFRPFVPFIRTPTNIFRQVIARGPLAPIQRQMREDFFAGGARRSAAVGKATTGSVLWGGALMFASEGRITGAGPVDPGERERLKGTGWRPYSFRVGGQYISFQRLDPIGMILGLAADFQNAANKMTDGDLQEAAAIMGVGLARNLTSKTYLTGITEVMEVMDQPDRNFLNWINKRAGSYVPTGIKQIADLTGFPTSDPVMREVRNVLDSIMSRTPGFSKNLPPDRDIITGDAKQFDSVINPFAVTTTNADPSKALVLGELARLQIGVEKPPRNIGLIELTPQQYDRLIVLITNPVSKKGKTKTSLVEALEKKMRSNLYDLDRKKFGDIPDDADALEGDSPRIRAVRRIISRYRSQALRLLKGENEELAQAFKDQRKIRTGIRLKKDADVAERLKALTEQ